MNFAKPFEKLIVEDQFNAKTYTSMIYDKVKYSCEANYSGAAVGRHNIKDPRLAYTKQCIAEWNLVLPLMDKIRGKTLFL